MNKPSFFKCSLTEGGNGKAIELTLEPVNILYNLKEQN